MTVEQLTTNIDLARRLEEVGCPQESYFCWALDVAGAIGVQQRWLVESSDDLDAICTTYTAEELLHFIPQAVQGRWGCAQLVINWYGEKGVLVEYVEQSEGYYDVIASVYETRLCDALAKMYVEIEGKGLV